MPRRRKPFGKGFIAQALKATFHASHNVPAVGCLIAAMLAIGWWKLRTNPSTPMQWLALVLGVLAIFFLVVALAGLVVILGSRPGRRGGTR